MRNILNPAPQRELTERERDRTVFIGPRGGEKPHHWTLSEEGYLRLEPGYTVYDELRAKAVESLLSKGVPHGAITAEMIEAVVEKATTAAIMSKMEGADAPAEA